MVQSYPPICVKCAHLIEDMKLLICRAYPEGIPKEIIINSVDHHKPLPGDHGIQFEAK